VSIGVFGVYIHFPYCRKRCPYCDFATHAREQIPHERYAEAVLRELEVRAPLFDGRRAVSIYFGGGTPGLWKAACVAEVLAAVQRRLGGDGAEITLEANPGELPLAQLEALRAAGINRLSLGVQSLQPKHLHTLGRLHGTEEPREAVANARRAGFDNLSLDLMFGLPGQSMEELDRDLDGLLSLEPEHLSIYNLTVEERTPFGAMKREGTLLLPDEGFCADLFERVRARATAAGFEHYEISNFARPGRRAVHNTLYWLGDEYLGLGSSAHSFRRGPEGGERFATVRSVDDWFERVPEMGGGPLADDKGLAMYERLAPDALEREAVWLGLRLLDGVDRAGHLARHGSDPVELHAATVERLVREGLAEVTPERLRLTHRGVLFADEVGARFV
jgi:oxygen-independent coproporphyrinogen-3 oxidase